MKNLTVIVIGLGSMGKRRIRLIKQINENIRIIGIDANKERAIQVGEEYGIEISYDLKKTIEKFHMEIDGAFVCTSPLSHQNIIRQLILDGINVFTEINLVKDGYDEILKNKQKNQVLFLSSTFLYREDIQYIIKRVNKNKVNYTYHTGQYLPDWHPWENYKDFFVNDRRTNGCREIMTIEFPWILECFGNVKNYSVLSGKLSTLDLNYDDNFVILLEHENGTVGTLIVDVVSRKARRSLEIFNENLHLFWNGTPDSLEEYDINQKEIVNIITYNSIDKDNNYCDNIIENAYMDEIKAYFKAICENDMTFIRYSFEKDYQTLSLLDEMGI